MKSKINKSNTEIEGKSFKNFENRVKHFTNDYLQIIGKVNENIENTRKILKSTSKNYLKTLKTDYELNNIKNIHDFLVNKEKIMKDIMIKNELQKYIFKSRKKTYFKSIEYTSLSPIFKNKDKKTLENISKFQKFEDRIFKKACFFNEKIDKIDLSKFKRPKELYDKYFNDKDDKAGNRFDVYDMSNEVGYNEKRIEKKKVHIVIPSEKVLSSKSLNLFMENEFLSQVDDKNEKN